MPLGLLHLTPSGGFRFIQPTTAAVGGAVIIHPSSVELRLNHVANWRPFGRIEAPGLTTSPLRGPPTGAPSAVSRSRTARPMWIAECLQPLTGRDDSALSACGEPVSETARPMGAASLDFVAYLAAGCAADHFLNPLAGLAVQERNIEIHPIRASRPLRSFAGNAIPLRPRAAPPVLRLQHTFAPICSGARSGLALRCSFHLRNFLVEALPLERAAYAGDAPRAMRCLL